MESVIYPKQLILEFCGRLNKRFPGEGIIYEELDAVLTGLYNSIRWSVLRRAESEQELGNITELPPTEGFASKWMERSEIIERIGDTSGLDDKMAEACLDIVEQMVERSLAEAATVALPPMGRITKGRVGFMIELSEAFQPQASIFQRPVAKASASATG